MTMRFPKYRYGTWQRRVQDFLFLLLALPLVIGFAILVNAFFVLIQGRP